MPSAPMPSLRRLGEGSILCLVCSISPAVAVRNYSERTSKPRFRNILLAQINRLAKSLSRGLVTRKGQPWNTCDASPLGTLATFRNYERVIHGSCFPPCMESRHGIKNQAKESSTCSAVFLPLASKVAFRQMTPGSGEGDVSPVGHTSFPSDHPPLTIGLVRNMSPGLLTTQAGGCT